jgi:hypothetical protein
VANPAVSSSRDLRIDWLRGLAMTCVIVNHSKLQSVLSWFSYERFWVVTAAEVFVVLSGVVLGMVYGRRIARDGWRAVVRGLSRRALTLYLAFVAVTLSIVVLSIFGVDIWVLTSGADQSTAWFTDPSSMDAAAWRDLLLMRSGVWAFEIVGLYVWLVLVAVPCLLVLHFVGWRPLLVTSWMVYLAYRIAPHPITSAEFEVVFPIAAWQLLFVHGIAMGYHRDRLCALASRCPRGVVFGLGAAAAMFFLFASCNPWMNGPSWLRLSLVSPDLFTSLYARYFALSELGLGRIANLAIGLPLGYAALTSCWRWLAPLHAIFITLGQRSLGAFVLHTYGLLLIAHIGAREDVWFNTVLQLLMIGSIAAILSAIQKTTALIRRPPVFGQRQRHPIGATA